MIELMQEAEKAGITVEYCSLPLNESMTFQDDEGDFILMDYSLIGTGAKERVHLGHEIGHSVLGAFYNPYSPLDVRQKHENRANKWAIRRLIPESALDNAVANGCTDIFSLAEHFEVTEDFMRMAVCWYTHGNLAVDLHF